MVWYAYISKQAGTTKGQTMRREDRHTSTVDGAAGFERAHADEVDVDLPSASDLLDSGIGGDWNLTRSDEDWAAAARSLWGDIAPQDEPPF
jgi:hypothetical protein